MRILTSILSQNDNTPPFFHVLGNFTAKTMIMKKHPNSRRSRQVTKDW